MIKPESLSNVWKLKMKKIRENICPQNATCPNVKICDASLIEELGYGFPIPIVENGKCIYCEKCQAAYLKKCLINLEE